MRLVEIVLDFSLQGDFAIATDDEHRQLRALFEDAGYPRSFAVDATQSSIRSSAS